MNRFWPLLIAGSLSAISPQPQAFRLPNGLQVRLLEDHERPLVRLQFCTNWDAAEIPAGREGLVGFLARLLDSSDVDGLNHEAFLRSLEDSALHAAFCQAPGTFTWSMVGTSQNLDPAFHGLATAVIRPAFNDASVEAQRQSLTQALAARPGRERAEDLFLRSLQDPQSLAMPEGSQLAAIQFRDLDRLRRRILRPERAQLVIYGDLNLDQARQLAALHFGAWGPGSEPALAPGTPVAVAAGRVWLVGDAASSLEIRVGCSLQKEGDHLLAAQELARRLLRRELTFGGSPDLGIAVLQDSPLVLRGVATQGTRLEDLLKEVQEALVRLRERTWTGSDLNLVRTNWKAEQSVLLLHPRRVTEALAARAATEPEAAILESPSSAEIQSIIRSWLEPANLRWLVLGARAADLAALGKAGLTPVKIVD